LYCEGQIERKIIALQYLKGKKELKDKTNNNIYIKTQVCVFIFWFLNKIFTFKRKKYICIIDFNQFEPNTAAKNCKI